MPAAPADSQICRDLFADAETAALFTDAAEIRAMLLVKARWRGFRSIWA
jgi:3-carboxy-cis,cis-muconate cycloisomerase